ncbi:hypothetical protein ABMA27_013216 [Loxostege sticticalis]|uniref:Uncharacterized protein n=1 Tax=Loxostege sticticalis TaxID=481309 RepID=A0ABR3IEI2_LOXSC
MGSHREWRKTVKRERRRRLRVLKAKQRDNTFPEEKDCEVWLEEQKRLEAFEYEQIEKSNIEENRKWMEAEVVAIKRWNALQLKKEQLHQLHLQKEAQRKLEYEIEQKRKKEDEERLKKIEEERRERQSMFMANLEHFLSDKNVDPPAELLQSRHTKPQAESCPFFSKTACCRFGDQCSRNHEYPGVSKILLAPNFFVHFGLSNNKPSEYDTDVMLEYEDSETYKEFVDFFKDVTPEFEKFGRITRFKVCKNYEKHLRGNTYIEYAELRCAVAAYRSIHSRWYGGRQLTLQFCQIDSWNSAICGLASTNRCPKGQSCNFLHVFRNPNDKFDDLRSDRQREYRNRTDSTPTRSWRWSESPEREMPKRDLNSMSSRKSKEEYKKSRSSKDCLRSRNTLKRSHKKRT